MFTGVRAHENARCVASYADAVKALEAASRTPTGRNRTEKHYGFPLGGHSKSVTWVRDRDEGVIAFRLYNTDVVVWHPDNSVEIDNFGSVTTSAFASRFLPRGINLNNTRTISYATKPDGYVWGGNICIGGGVRFREHGDVWLPDEDTLDTINYPEVDRVKARAVTKSYPFKDFEMWLSMAPMHLDLEHHEFDLTTCSDALLDRDFRRAATHLPLVKVPRGFGVAERMKPLNISVRGWDYMITLASLRKLKVALWDLECAITTAPRKTPSRVEHDRRMKLVREMQSVGCDAYEYGPQ